MDPKSRTPGVYQAMDVRVMLSVCVDELGRDITSTIKQKMLNHLNQMEGMAGKRTISVRSTNLSILSASIYFLMDNQTGPP